MAEQDFLKDILEKTQANFIDVNQEPNILDDKEMEERMSRYNKHLLEDAPEVDPAVVQRITQYYSPQPEGEEVSSKLTAETYAIHEKLVQEKQKEVVIDTEGMDELVVSIESLN